MSAFILLRPVQLLLSLLTLFLVLAACGPHHPGMRRDVGIYRSCAVYAGAVDYVFEVNGRPVMVRVSKVEQEPQPRVPANLVEPVTDKLEGPPGANKALVGKRFYLYSINERVLSVVPVEKE